MGRLLGVGPGLPVTGNARINDGRIDRCHVVVAQTQPCHGAGGEVLQNDIRLSRHLQEQLTASFGPQIQRDALDALAALQEAGGDVLLGLLLRLDPVGSRERAVAAHRIASARYFHFDDLGAQPGQRHAQKRTGKENSNGQNPEIRKRLA